ncbi:MAG: ABC-F family ATP-binding cassette domain-containing protein [Ruminococcaceae bacterium]|nr:ABC-F family ATP-binding cassette domain-containing protein [Oscillospiraceae bacterium]
MFIIGTEKLGVSFGEKVLLENVSFSVNQGEKVSIVGVNGAGKSTLMRLLYNRSLPYTGNIFIAKGKTVGHLEQQSQLNPEATVYEAALGVFKTLSEEERRLEALSEELKYDYSEDKIKRYSALQQRFEQQGGYEYKSRAKGTLISMGFEEEKLNLKVSALSGGQRTILQLSLLILEEPDILLLDEPTNHLDIRSLEWLEEKLKKIRSTVLLISHDRLFLDRITEKTLEIENTHAKLYSVPYSKYREQKKAEREIQDRHYKNQQKEIARIEAFIAQQKRWNREKNIIAAESRQKALDRMIKVDKAEALPESLSFRFSSALESGEDVLTVKNLSKAYGQTVLFRDLSFEIKKKDRFLIIGANGSGKSTLLQILAGNASADCGIYRYGYNVRLGYYDQYQHLNENSTVLEELWSESDLTHTEIRSLLATFLFKGDDVFKEIRVLSGGERARLVLAKLMQRKVNLLLLDEPTNHLDIESREALEEAILSFEGTVIAVSHDRYFINRIATRMLSFEGAGNVFEYNGSFADFSEYVSKTKNTSDVPSALPHDINSKNNWEQKKKQKQEERKKQSRLAKIEIELEEAETRIRAIDEESEKCATDYVALQALYEEKTNLEKKCDLLLEEWSSLEEN